MIALPRATDPRVSIVIVTARRPDRLLRCLAAIAREVPADLACEVVVVLNAAEPALRAQLAAEVAGARVVESEIPLGFAGGANLGALHARGALLHHLHDDTEVGRGWLVALTAALDAHPEAGAAGSLVLGFDGAVQTAGYVLWRDGTTSPPWTGPPPPPESFGRPYAVDYCASASLLIRTSAWDATGGFNEDLHPAYYVDVDLAMALRDAGHVVLCAPGSRVLHERGGSSGSAFRAFVSARNRELFVARWSRDLAAQEPPGEGADALDRARAATARRAAAVAAMGPRAGRATPAAGVDDEVGRLRREHLQLRRDVAVKDAFIAHAERLLAEAAATRDRLEADGAIAQRALVDVHEANAAVHDRYAALQREYELLRADRDAVSARLAAAEARPRVPRRLVPIARLWRRARGRPGR
jgi:GT2 family glycosyltransferase